MADDYWPKSSYTRVPFLLLSMLSWIGMHCGYVALGKGGVVEKCITNLEDCAT